MAGASAALLGLLFVAVSINLERILSFEGLPEQALERLMLPLGVLVVAIVGLMPDQSQVALGIEGLVAGIVFAIIGAVGLRTRRTPRTAGLRECADAPLRPTP